MKTLYQLIQQKSKAIAAMVGILILMPMDTDAALVGQWNFNENAGTSSVDASGNGNNATLQGTAGWGAGAVVNDFASTFDGTSATVDYGTDSLFNLGQNYTLAIWVNPTVLAGEQLFFGKGYNFSLTYFGSNVYFYGGGTAGNVPLAAGAWSLVVGVFDTGLTTIYVNNETPVIFNIGTTIPDTSAIALTSGQALFGANLFQGSLSQAQIYDNSLLSGDVADLFAAGPVAIPEPSVLAVVMLGGIVLLGRRVCRQA
jgi:hypothetical protein